jgi:hypothetical protein
MYPESTSGTMNFEQAMSEVAKTLNADRGEVIRCFDSSGPIVPRRQGLTPEMVTPSTVWTFRQQAGSAIATVLNDGNSSREFHFEKGQYAGKAGVRLARVHYPL